MLNRWLSAVAALVVSGGACMGQDERPLTFEDVSDAAEIRVVLPSAAAVHPALHGEMERDATDALERFRREAEKAMTEAAGASSYPWTPWSLDYIYEPRYLGPVYASFLVNILSYQGGAHPSLDYAVVTRDLELNEPVMLFDLFADADEGAPALVAMSGYIREDLARQKAERMGEPLDPENADWLDAVAPRPENFQLFTFEPAREKGQIAGLTFHYPPYVVGPYAEGPYDVFVPASVFADHLAGYFPAIFGGEPVEMTRLSSYEDPGAFVFLQSPGGDDIVRSPLPVAGEAPASWFEAGEIVLRVEDFDGNELGRAVATPDPSAETSNITAGMVRFTGSVPFEAPGAAEGQLVIAPPEGGGSEVATYLRF